MTGTWSSEGGGDVDVTCRGAVGELVGWRSSGGGSGIDGDGGVGGVAGVGRRLLYCTEEVVRRRRRRARRRVAATGRKCTGGESGGP